MAGANYDIVVLSSSPPRPPETGAPSSPLNDYRSSPRRVAMPASPLLSHSPPVSPQKKPSGASGAGSRKAPIPPEAIRGFATADSLVRSEHFARQLHDGLSEEQDAEEVTAVKKKPTKRSAATTAGDGNAKPKPKPRARKPKADSDKPARDPELRLPPSKTSHFFPKESAEAASEQTAESGDDAPKLTKSGKPRKPRAKKEKTGDAPVESKPKKSTAAKPKTASKATGESQREHVVSAHFRTDGLVAQEPVSQTPPSNQEANTTDASIWDVPSSPKPKKKRAPKQPPPAPIVEDLELKEAVSRRRDWTPPQDTTIPSPFTDSVGKENRIVEPDGNGNGAGFTHLVSNFAYAQSPAARATTHMAASTTEAAAATKRRRVELIDVPGNQSNSRNSSPEKGKAPKKKARTITDKATEEYQVRDINEAPSGVTSDFFQPGTTVTKVPLNDTTASNGDALAKKLHRKRPISKPASEKGTVPAKSKKASAKTAAKPKTMAEKLLSPGSALLRMSKQDILFGTSSQLALEESPTLVRQLQQAMKESEEDADGSLSSLLGPPPQWPKLKKVEGKRGLWDASSRDVESGLLEQMEDVYMPEFDRTQEYPLLMGGANDELDHAPDSFVDIDDVVPAPAVVISSDLPTPPPAESREPQYKPSAGAYNTGRAMQDEVFDDIDDFDFARPPSNQMAESQDSFVDIDDVLPVSAHKSALLPPKPRPPASISVSSSPKKRRGRPPKSKASMPAAGAAPSPPKKNTSRQKHKDKSTPAPPTTPPKSSSRFHSIDEILDSDSEAMHALSPTPPRIHKLPDSLPLPLSPSRAKEISTNTNVHRIPAAHLAWQNIKCAIFAGISAHIRSLPPTRDPSCPSWHEKILLYEPLVLEDFTAYLNAHTGLRSWKRATKAQVQSGDVRAADDDDDGEIFAVEKELEAWQVREWCESASVCCVYGERKGGGKRKGAY